MKTPTKRAATAEIVRVSVRNFACNGGGGGLGHPKVWYEMGHDDVAVCKYCERRFVLIGSAEDPERQI
jgi:uncharacterized Zn-finger protein